MNKIYPLFLSSLSFASVADDNTQDATSTNYLDTIVITATKTNATLQDVPNSVSLLNEEDLKEIKPINMIEALDWIPGVQISSSNAHLGQPSIRGLDRGRVIINVDGINQTVDGNKGMALSPFQIDPYLIKQIEVQKGSSSVLYGSGGLGGIISVQTKSVSDLLPKGQQLGGFVRFQYNDLYNNSLSTIGVYGTDKKETIDWMITGTADRNSNNINDNLIKGNNNKINAKLGWNIDDNQRLEAQLNNSKRKFINERVINPDIAKTSSAQLNYTLNRGNHINFKSSVSTSQTKRKASMKFAGQQDSTVNRKQIDIQNTHFMGSDVQQEITYGFSGNRIQQSGTVNGIANSFIAPEGTRTELGFFLQDRIDWSHITLIGALRYNRYQMKSSNNPSITENKLLPSVGLTVNATDWLSLHANYSHDFRAPSIDDLYTTAYGFYPGIDIISNPNLKPESSRNKTLGFTLHKQGLFSADDSASLRATYFDQDITDMITISNLGFNPVTGNMEFSSINKNSVDRRGVELEARYDNNNLSFSLATDYLREKDNKTGSISHPPRTLKMRTSYTFPNETMTLSWLAKAASKHKKSRSEYYRGYMTHDLRFHWDEAMGLKGLNINAGINNVFDKKYDTYYGAKGAERNFHIGFLAEF